MDNGNMKAWVLQSSGNLQLKNVPIPVPNENEVLIKIDAFCICNGSDPEIYHGHEAYPFPLIFGHEASGHIIETGKNIHDWRIGRWVCWWCVMGAFAEYIAVNPDKVAMFPVPDGVSMEESPVLELVIAAGRALMPLTGNCEGKTLGILGLGPSGLVALQYAKALGFNYVWGWDLYPMRRKLALELGIDAVCDPSSPEFAEKAAGLPEADVALDMMGDERMPDSTFNRLLRKTRANGTIVSYGHPEHGRLFSPYVFQSHNLTMISPENRLPVIREKGKHLMEWIASGKIRIGPLVTEVLEFDMLGNSFRYLLEHPDRQIKMVFTVRKKGCS